MRDAAPPARMAPPLAAGRHARHPVRVADSIMDLVEGAMGSPWVYLALLAFAALDAFFPIVPSESLVITAGVFSAANGEPALPLVIVAAGLGAFIGDHISYFIGRTAGERMMKRAKPGSKKAAAWARGHKLLTERGGVILIVCRYIPGARTAITLTAGAVSYRLRSFSFFDAIAAQLVGGVLRARRLHRRRGVRGLAVEGPRARPRHRAHRHRAGRDHPAPAAAEDRDVLITARRVA